VLTVIARAAPPADQPVARIAFGSCARQEEPQPIWDKIVDLHPDLFLFIGDNIYGDSADMEMLKARYAKLGAMPGFQKLRASCPLLATWDDHDYGINDGGRDFPQRDASQKVFLDFFGDPPGSERRHRPGVYTAQVFGPVGKRVQIILLDTRYFRSPLKAAPKGDPRGPYVPTDDPAATMLGDAQWVWLAEQLKVPAEVRIIASSIQVVAEDHGYEKWMNMPAERERLFKAIRDAHAAGIILLSGDRHLAELSMIDAGIGYPLYDLTSSGLNAGGKKWRGYEENRHRVGTMNWGDNFGMVTIDWSQSDPRIALSIYDDEGDVNIRRKIRLSTLQPGVIGK
jgi:alkaline phosphatase D